MMPYMGSGKVGVLYIHLGVKSGAADYGYMSRSPILDVPRCAKVIQLTIPYNIHEVYQGLWPRKKTKDTNTTVLGRIGGGTNGREVLRTTIQDGDRSDKGVPAIPNSI